MSSARFRSSVVECNCREGGQGSFIGSSNMLFCFDAAKLRASSAALPSFQRSVREVPPANTLAPLSGRHGRECELLLVATAGPWSAYKLVHAHG